MKTLRTSILSLSLCAFAIAITGCNGMHAADLKMQMADYASESMDPIPSQPGVPSDSGDGSNSPDVGSGSGTDSSPQPTPTPVVVNPTPAPTPNPTPSPTATPSLPISNGDLETTAKAVTWTGDWENGVTGKGNWKLLQVASSYSFQRVTSPVRQGKYAARIEIRPGDIAQSSSSARSEVSHALNSSGQNVAPKDGETSYIAFSIMLDKTWQAPDDWGIIMQLHSASGNPMFTIRAEDEFYVTTNGGNTCTNSKITAHKFSDGALNRGKWVDFVLKVKWSTTTNGTITVWRRDQGESQFKTILDKSGIANLKSCVNDIYWKTGLYRGPNTKHTSIYYQDGLSFGKTFNDVVAHAFNQ